MTWQEEHQVWLAHRARVRALDREAIRDGAKFKGRKRVGECDAASLAWLRAALHDEELKWFVADVFETQPVPEALFTELLRAGVYERDPSYNREFIAPCVRDFGGVRVYEVLLTYLATGSDAEKAGAANALYWAHLGDDPGAKALYARERALALQEFVRNECVRVRQCLIPQLPLEEAAYPAELRPLVAQAIAIARAHPDDYIRHRVEIQLGSGGPLMALPSGGGASAEVVTRKAWWQFWRR